MRNLAHGKLPKSWMRCLLFSIIVAALGTGSCTNSSPDDDSKIGNGDGGKVRVESIIRFSPRSSQMLSGYGSKPSNYKQTQVALIQSHQVLSAVLRRPEVRKLSLIRSVRKSKDDPVSWLQKQIEIDELESPAILIVALTGKDRQELVVLLDAVVDTYISEVFGEEREYLIQRRDRTEEEYNERREQVRLSREKLHKLGIKYGTVSIEGLPESPQQQLIDEYGAVLRQEIAKMQVNLLKLEIDLWRFRQQHNIEDEENPPREVQWHDEFVTIKNQRDELREDIEMFESAYDRSMKKVTEITKALVEIQHQREELDGHASIARQLGADLARLELELVTKEAEVFQRAQVVKVRKQEDE